MRAAPPVNGPRRDHTTLRNLNKHVFASAASARIRCECDRARACAEPLVFDHLLIFAPIASVRRADKAPGKTTQNKRRQARLVQWVEPDNSHDENCDTD